MGENAMFFRRCEPSILPERYLDGFQDCLRIRQHVIVPKPNDPVVKFFQQSSAPSVCIGPIRMLPAIHFGDQPSGNTSEIGHIGTDGNLPAKMMAIELIPAQSTPEP